MWPQCIRCAPRLPVVPLSTFVSAPCLIVTLEANCVQQEDAPQHLMPHSPCLALSLARMLGIQHCALQQLLQQKQGTDPTSSVSHAVSSAVRLEPGAAPLTMVVHAKRDNGTGPRVGCSVSAPAPGTLVSWAWARHLVPSRSPHGQGATVAVLAAACPRDNAWLGVAAQG